MKLPWVSRALYEQALAASAQFLHDKQVAEDRLYAAWREGAQVPPRASVEPPAPREVRVLPDKLHAWIQNWESADVRGELETEARRLHFEQGYPEERVLALFEARSGNGTEPG
jgi:hypothetical protein